MQNRLGLTITFLGTGTSHGVPVVDCMMSDYDLCPKGVCQEAHVDSLHRRTRSSILLEYKGLVTLIDVSSDFREQMLRQNVRRIDAVLVTHRHADHISGLPDIRSYSRILDDGLPIWGTNESINGVKNTFSYIFDPNTFVGGGIPQLIPHIFSNSFVANGIVFTPIPVEHGDCSGCVGFRFFDVAYIPDVKRVPQESLSLLRGVHTLIIDCLRMDKEHSTHMIYPEVQEVSEKIGAKNIFLTHMCHDIHYKNDAYLLNENSVFSYDGLTLEL